MIVTKHTVICDGCGLTGPTAPTIGAATDAALADGWSYGGRSLALADEHWCPPCTTARTQPTTKE